MTHVTSCPVCGNSDLLPFLTCTDHTVSRESFSLIVCSTCKFVVTSPRPDNEVLGNYYQSADYISHTSKANSLTDRLYLLARTFTLKNKTQLIAKLQPGKGSILDVGCGTGDFLQACAETNWDVIGMEPSQQARMLAEQKGIKTFENLDAVTGTFNVITLWHVLEHVAELNKTLETLHTLLEQKGVLLIAVPNHQSSDGKKYKEHWAGFDVPRHLWHFNQQNMERLLRKHGFILSTTLPMKLDSYYVSLLSETYVGKGILRYVTAFLAGLKSNLRARRTNEYSSLIYIAHK